jgi:hypothetical protein
VLALLLGAHVTGGGTIDPDAPVRPIHGDFDKP